MRFEVVVAFSIVCVVCAFAEETPAATQAVEKVCEPGKVFTKGDSSCTCNSTGTEYTCEKLDCPEGGNGPQVTPETVTGEKCTPGELYKEKCNECKCPESGLKSQAACTIIGCSDD